jgi:thiamine kinase-like enzyme
LIDVGTLAVSLDQPVTSFRRRPYAYRTSHRVEELEVVLDDGTKLDLLLKHLQRSELGADARRAKPAFLHNSRREAEAYRLLATADLGAPVCYASTNEWMLIEKVPGVELWQLGDLEAWTEAARWLERLHTFFVEHPPRGEHLLRYDADYFGIWPARALRRYPELGQALRGYEQVIDLLVGLPATLVHGEFYASNVLVAERRIAPVDWEMAGVGPGILDLAALATGWSEKKRGSIVAAYGTIPKNVLNAACFHLALQWLGWSHKWTPPPQHAHDWLSEAMRAAEQLGL